MDVTIYTCEHCGREDASWAVIMRCENDDYDEAMAACKNHVSPRIMRPMRDWLEADRCPGKTAAPHTCPPG